MADTLADAARTGAGPDRTREAQLRGEAVGGETVRADNTETVVVPLAREELVTSRREVETGRVRVRTVVDERQELIREELSRTDVEIERVPLNLEVETAPMPRTEGDTYIIPVVEEVIYVRKALVVTEEIRLHRRTSTEKVEQPVTVRSQRAVVERETLGGEPVRRALEE